MKPFNLIHIVTALGFAFVFSMMSISMMGCAGSKKSETKKNTMDSTGNAMVKISKYDSIITTAGVTISNHGQTITMDTGNTTMVIEKPEFSGKGNDLFSVLLKADKVTIKDNRRQSVKFSTVSLLIDSTKGIVKSRTDSTVKTITKVKKQDTVVHAEKKAGFPWWIVIVICAASLGSYFLIKNII